MPLHSQEYGRVDRIALKKKAFEGCARHGAQLLQTGVTNTGGGQVVHGASASVVKLDDGTTVTARMVVDATNGKSGLTRKAGGENPGVQIAYGAVCDVDDHPFDEDAMVFMDYRTDWITGESMTSAGTFGAPRVVRARQVQDEPTFLYAMPMGKGPDGNRRIFFEETSLVARPPMDFDECKARLDLRLANLGVRVRAYEEEEFCYIPMGNALPSARQRVVAIGAGAGTVHASTGYMLCRMIASSIAVAEVIADQLAVAQGDDFDASAASAAAYGALWPMENRLQRDFAIFGGEYLMRQPVVGLRGFFGGFFALPEEMWTGFLAGWPGLPGNEAHDSWEKRLVFGIYLWLRVPTTVKLSLVTSAVQFGGIGFLRSVLPLLQQTTFADLVLAEASAQLRTGQGEGRPKLGMRE